MERKKILAQEPKNQYDQKKKLGIQNLVLQTSQEKSKVFTLKKKQLFM